MTDPIIRNVSDTARWAAVYRAEESRRHGALFQDPFAEKLAGERGRQIYESLGKKRQQSWAWVTRTVLFDAFINAEIARGADMVLNLAAGLDARPYRMPLSPSLQWVEVDLPEILAYKADVLKNDTPRCALERIAVDLSDGAARRALFDQLSTRAQRILVITEGLLLYLDPDEVGRFAEDLAARPSMSRWVTDIASPGLLKLIQKQLGSELSGGNAPPKFAPAEGVEFFASHGWRAIDVRSMLKEAGKIYPLPFMLKFFSMFPESPKPGNRPWSGVVLLGR